MGFYDDFKKTKGVAVDDLQVIAAIRSTAARVFDHLGVPRGKWGEMEASTSELSTEGYLLAGTNSITREPTGASCTFWVERDARTKVPVDMVVRGLEGGRTIIEFGGLLLDGFDTFEGFCERFGEELKKRASRL